VTKGHSSRFSAAGILREVLSKLWETREALVWLGAFWLLVSASTAPDIGPFAEELFQFQVLERFWKVILVSWPVTVACATVLIASVLAWRRMSEDSFAARAMRVTPCPSEHFLVWDEQLRSCIFGHPHAPASGETELNIYAVPGELFIIAGFFQYYGQTNFVLAVGLAFFFTF
jgi:hypothetical protein